MSRILVIDDNEQIRNVLKRILEREGHHVVIVEDSESGLSCQKQQSFDLIITDILLPDKEGISTILELHTDYPSLKIIAISGGGSFQPYGYLDIAKRVGANRTLPKPFNRDELLQVVNELLM